MIEIKDDIITFNMFKKLDELEKFLKDNIISQKVNILLGDIEKYSFEDIKNFIDIVSQYNIELILKKDNSIETRNNKIPYLYSKEEFDLLNKINKYYYEKTNKELLYQEYRNNKDIRINENCWKHSQVKKANSSIEEIVSYIKERKLTPFETMIFIHEYVSNFIYKTEEKTESSEKSRNIVEILNSNNPAIVCVGYSSLVKAIIDKLNMVDLKCEMNYCRVPKYSSIDDSRKHVNNVIIIKDNKYNIDGAYLEDACWDSKDNSKDVTFANFLYSFNDRNNFLNMDYMLEKDSEGINDYERVFDRYLLEEFTDKNSNNEDNNNIELITNKILYKLKSLNIKEENILDCLKLCVNKTTSNYYKQTLQKVIHNLLNNKDFLSLDKEILDYNIKSVLDKISSTNKTNKLYLSNNVKGYKEIYDNTLSVIDSYGKIGDSIDLKTFKTAYINYRKKCNKTITKEELNAIVNKSIEHANNLFNSNSENMFIQECNKYLKTNIDKYINLSSSMYKFIEEVLLIYNTTKYSVKKELNNKSLSVEKSSLINDLSL